MTKEKLKQEARKDVDSLNGIDLVSSTIIAIDKYGAYKLGRYDGYLASAEPREKRIAELEQALEGYKQNAKWCDKCDKVAELEKENTKLQQACHKWFMRWREAKKDALYFDSSLQKQIEATLDLQKENAELKDDNKVMADNYSKMEQKFYDNLTKAKELLKRCYDNYIYLQLLRGDIEQFLNSEVEK